MFIVQYLSYIVLAGEEAVASLKFGDVDPAEDGFSDNQTPAEFFESVVAPLVDAIENAE